MARAALARLTAGVVALLMPTAVQALDSDCLTAPLEPRRLAAVDLDGDHDLDVAVATTDGILFMMNDGEGLLRFLREEEDGPHVLLRPEQGFVDLGAVARSANLPLELVAMNEEGRLTAFQLGPDLSFPVTWGADIGPALRVAWADMDSDGDMDLAVARGDGGVTLLVADEGALTVREERAGIGRVTDVAWAELIDGRLGLAVGTDGLGRIYAVDGSDMTELGTTSLAGAERVVWQDRDGDGQPEALFGGTLEVLSPTTTGVVSQTPIVDPPMDPGILIAVADRFVVTAGSEEPISTLFRASVGAGGEATWSHAHEIPRPARGTDLIAAELDMGVLSVITAGVLDDDDYPFLLCNSPVYELDLPPPRTWPLPDGQSYPQRIALGDVDLDGWPDLAVAANDTLVVVRNEDGGFGEEELLRVDGLQLTHELRFDDIDADGYPELLVSFQGAGPLQANPALMIFDNTGGGLESLPVWSSDSSSELSVAPADVDGDGLIDLVVGLGDGQVTIRRGCEEGSAPCFEPESAWQTQTSWGASHLAWGDLDGDRDLDLAVWVYQDGINIFENRSTPGQIELVRTVVLPSTDGGDGLAWVDWNGDGAPDLLESSTLNIQLHRNVAGTLEPVWLNPASMFAGRINHLDWDRDGDQDLVVETPNGDVSVYLQGHQGPTFAPSRRVLHEIGVSRTLTTGDVDGDGRQDLLYATWDNTLVLRTAPVLDAGLPTRNPTVAAWVESAEPVLGPIDPRPLVIALRVADPDSDPVAAIELDYSVRGGGLWVPATAVTGDLIDVDAPAGGARATIVWDWASEGVPADHPLSTDHPIDHDRLALRVRALPGDARTVAGPLVITSEVSTTTEELRRWPDEDEDGVPNRWDPCHQDPNDDSDGDGSCDSDDLCQGNDETQDLDGDGFCDNLDCDDLDATLRPDAPELCLDGRDNDCDKATDSADDDCGPEVLAETGLWCGAVGPGRPVGAAGWVVLGALLGIRRRRVRRR